MVGMQLDEIEKATHALSVYPVWAWAIVHGHKRVENRTWRTRLRERIWIHAMADSAASRRADSDARAILVGMGIAVPTDVPKGAIVGSVEIVAVVMPDELPHDPLASGPVCWCLDGASPLVSPVHCSGRQGLWRV